MEIKYQSESCYGYKCSCSELIFFGLQAVGKICQEINISFETV